MPGNDMVNDAVSLTLRVELPPGLRIEECAKDGTLIVKIAEADDDVGEIAHEHDGPHAERLHELEIRLSGTAVLLSDGRHGGEFEQRREKEILLTLAGGVEEKQIAKV